MFYNYDNKKIAHLKISKDDNKSIQHTLQNTTYLKISDKDIRNEIIAENKKIKIPFNQINTINKYGIFYYYDENGIYFFDKNSINKLLIEKKIGKNFLFYLKSFQKIFKVEILEIKSKEQCANININNVITYLVIISKGGKGNFIIYINIDTLFKEVSKQESINIKDIFKIKEEEKDNIKEKKSNEENDLKNNNLIVCNDIIFTIFSNNNENIEEENIKNEEDEKNENIKKVNKIDEEVSLDLDMEINIHSMIKQNYYVPNKFKGNKIIYIENDFNNIIPINFDRYLILKNTNEIDIYDNDKIIKSFKENINYIYYYEKLKMIILIFNNNVIGYNSETFEEKIYLQSKDYAINYNKAFLCDIINDFIIIIAQNEKITVYFINYDFQINKINNIYYDEYENKNQNNNYFSIYEEENGLYYLINKNNISNSLTEKIYYLKNYNNKNISIYDITFNIDEKEENGKKEENNYIIGMNIIKFIYENYENNKIKINDIEYDELFILISLDINGNMKVYYIVNTKNKNKLQNIENNIYNLNNKICEINLNNSFIFGKKIKCINEMNKYKYNGINNRLESIKRQYKNDIISNNIKERLNMTNQKYIKLINHIKANVDINNINLIFKHSEYLQNSFNSLNDSYEEMNNYYLKGEEFKKYISNEINNLNNLENETIKRKIKKWELIDETKKFNSLKNYSYINKIDCIETIISNKIFNNYIKNEDVEKIKKVSDQYNKTKKDINISFNSKNELNNLNEEFQKNIDLCNYMAQKLQNQYLCFKNMNNNEEKIQKIYDNVYSLYINAFKEHVLKLNKLAIKELSKQKLLISKLNKINKNEIYERRFNNQLDINDIISESFSLFSGRVELFENKTNKKLIYLDNEFQNEKNENEINNKKEEKNYINPLEQRKMNYELLLKMKNKLIEINKDNNIILENLRENEKEIKKMLEESESKTFNDLYHNIIPQKNKILESKYNINSKEKQLLQKKYDFIFYKEKALTNKYNKYKELNKKLLVLKEEIESIKEKYEEKNEENENLEGECVDKEIENNQIKEKNNINIEENKNEELNEKNIINENIDNNEDIKNNVNENNNNNSHNIELQKEINNNLIELQSNLFKNRDNSEKHENEGGGNKNEVDKGNNNMNINNIINNINDENINKSNVIMNKMLSDNNKLFNIKKDIEKIEITKKGVPSDFQNNIINEQNNNIGNIINKNILSNLNNEKNNKIINTSNNINNTINNNQFKADSNINVFKQAQVLDNLQSLAGSKPISKTKKKKEITIINRGPNNENILSNAFSSLNLKETLNNEFNFDDDNKEEEKNKMIIGNQNKKENPFDSIFSKSNINNNNSNNNSNNIFNGGNINDKNMLNNIFNNNSSNNNFNLFSTIKSTNNNITQNSNPFIQKANDTNNNISTNNNAFNNITNNNSSIFRNSNNINLNNTNGSNYTFGQHNQSLSNQNYNTFGYLSNNNINNNNSNISFGNFNNLNNIQSPFAIIENKNDNIFNKAQGSYPESQEKFNPNPFFSKQADENYFD